MAILDEGNLLIITGHMKSGKTHHANVITEKKAEKNYHLYTNVNYFKPANWGKAMKKGLLSYDIEYVIPPKNVHITNKMSDLLSGLTKTNPNVVILDEAMIYAGYDRHGSKVLRWFKDFVVQCRKFNTSVVLITQVKSQLTKLLREQLEHYEVFCQLKNGEHIGRTYKYYPADRETGIREMETGPVRYLPSVGHYPYDTKSPASLQIDVDMEGLLGDISVCDSIEIVDEMDVFVQKWLIDLGPKKPKEKKISKKAKAFSLFASGVTNLKKMAEDLDTTYHTICDYKSEYNTLTK